MSKGFLRTWLKEFMIFVMVLFISHGICAQIVFDDNNPPDYAELHYWAAHPEKDHPGNLVPDDMEQHQISIEDVDIFYIHPTTYTVKKPKTWNGELNSDFLNEITDNKPLKYQASLFNQVGTLYAPRYRQAHITVYDRLDSKVGQRALNLAYVDVKNAFEYYVRFFNQGRPFIIASHSQGTTHAIKLIKEVIDESVQLQSQMIVAYLVGMGVKKEEFKSITPCEKPDEFGCFNSWRTHRINHEPPEYMEIGNEYSVINPLTWDVEKSFADESHHQGAVLRKFNKVFYHILNSESDDGVLWVSRPKFPFSFLMTRKDYHIADYNFFYYNVQQNALERTKAYLTDD